MYREMNGGMYSELYSERYGATPGEVRKGTLGETYNKTRPGKREVDDMLRNRHGGICAI